jgi:GNAT superfamily N-acetyltransferase
MSAPPCRDSGDAELDDLQHPSRGSRTFSSHAVHRQRGDDGQIPCIRALPNGARIDTARVGDHPLVLRVLMEVQQTPLVEDFQSRLAKPGYRAGDRLLLRHGDQVIGQVFLARHVAWFDGRRISTVVLEDFAVLPEYHDSCGSAELLEAAHAIAASEGAVLALVRTDAAEWFTSRGWSTWRAQGYTHAGAHGVLAYLEQQGEPRQVRRPRVRVRQWRHLELDAIGDIYANAATGLWGPVSRSEDCWQWLVGRKAHDLILIATCVDRELHQRGSDAERAIGYAIVRGSAIVELMTLPGWSGARVRLLAAACRDAVDRGHNAITLHTFAADPLHELLVTAGGRWMSDDASRAPRWMMRLLAPERWIERCYELWRERAQLAGVPRPLEIGLGVGEAKYSFSLTRRSARLQRVESLRGSWVKCDRPVFEQLLVGNLDIARSAASGSLTLSDGALQRLLSTVFAPRIFWQSLLERLRL